MALVDTTWYCNFGNGTSTGYFAVALRPQNAAVAAGVLCRQFTAPAVGSERCFVCIIAGTTANVTDATWATGRGAKTTDGTATWMECTGQASLNGDLTNTATWAQVKAATPAVLGQVIKRSNNASYQICTTAGAMSASEPAFSDTAGVTTTDTTAVWTSLGPVSNFTGGQAPHARLNSVNAGWFLSGNTIYVGDNHAEVQGTNLFIAQASAALARILCHNHSGSYPPTASDLTTGATISSTTTATCGTSGSGSFYFYGLTFIAGVGGASTGQTLFINAAASIAQVQNWHYYDNCSFVIAATGSACYMNIGAGQAASWCVTIFNNTTVKFASTGQRIALRVAQLKWQNTGQILAAGSSVPALFLAADNTGMNVIELEALDLSQLTGVIIDALSNSAGIATIKDCKLNASATIIQPLNTAQQVQFIRSDSAAIAYKSTRNGYEGNETTETSITRIGGAVDPTGQAQSRKIVTTANAQWLRPFQAEPYSIWNTTTGANVTVTVCGTINAASLPNNDDIWIEVEYLGSSATPLGTIVRTTKASLLASNAAVASDGSSWNGGGSGAGWSPFKLVATLSAPQPGMAGYIDVRVRAAKASTTYYLDPKIELT